MPELPEVETVVRGLAPDLIGATLQTATSDWPRVLDGWRLSDFNQAINGHQVRKLHRRGKYICISLDEGFLVVHLRMTGRLYIGQTARGEDAWVRLSIGLEDGRFLHFSDARKFGRVRFSRELAYLEEKLGPEPLDANPADLQAVLHGSSRAIKTFLLDQKKIAGVGNIYADESLYLAGIHPQRPVDRLTAPQRSRLVNAIQKVLHQAIDYEGASIQWYRKPDGNQGESQKHFLVYGRGDQPCLECGTPIKKITLGQRGTHFCPRCQKR